MEMVKSAKNLEKPNEDLLGREADESIEIREEETVPIILITFRLLQ